MDNIHYNFVDVEIPDFNPEFFSLWLSKVIKSYDKLIGPLSFVFCSDEYLLDMNIKYLNHDYYTDIITFDYREGDTISGDLLISVDRVVENAGDLQVDWRNELNRVVVHGVLHIIGYKDKSELDEKVMREKEDFYLGFT